MRAGLFISLLALLGCSSQEVKSQPVAEVGGPLTVRHLQGGWTTAEFSCASGLPLKLNLDYSRQTIKETLQFGEGVFTRTVLLDMKIKPGPAQSALANFSQELEQALSLPSTPKRQQTIEQIQNSVRTINQLKNGVKCTNSESFHFSLNNSTVKVKKSSQLNMGCGFMSPISGNRDTFTAELEGSRLTTSEVVDSDGDVCPKGDKLVRTYLRK